MLLSENLGIRLNICIFTIYYLLVRTTHQRQFYSIYTIKTDVNFLFLLNLGKICSRT